MVAGFAGWDLAFQAIPIALVDPEWSKRQLILMLREWYMHPSGQMAAYEWNFGDVNPPVHCWATLRVFQITKTTGGKADYAFLEKSFHKLLLNFAWCVLLVWCVWCVRVAGGWWLVWCVVCGVWCVRVRVRVVWVSLKIAPGGHGWTC